MRRTVDKTKKANMKCEHCKHFDTHEKTIYDAANCILTGEPKKYWNQCKGFEWRDEK